MWPAVHNFYGNKSENVNLLLEMFKQFDDLAVDVVLLVGRSSTNLSQKLCSVPVPFKQKWNLVTLLSTTIQSLLTFSDTTIWQLLLSVLFQRKTPLFNPIALFSLSLRHILPRTLNTLSRFISLDHHWLLGDKRCNNNRLTFWQPVT